MFGFWLSIVDKKKVPSYQNHCTHYCLKNTKKVFMISKIFFQLTKSATQKIIKISISWALLKKTKIRLQNQTNYR